MKTTILQKAQMKKYYETHKAEFLSRNKEYRKSNRDKVLGYQRKSNQKHQYSKKWRIANPEKWLMQHRIQEQRRRKAGWLRLSTVQKVYENNIKKYGVLTCELCKKSVSKQQDSIDHKKPISKGGTHHMNNLQIAHRICNGQKSDKWFI